MVHMKISADLDMGGPPELKSDEFFVSTPTAIEILSCHQIFTAEKVLPFIGASVKGDLNRQSPHLNFDG